jgi:hypothetical protein
MAAVMAAMAGAGAGAAAAAGARAAAAAAAAAEAAAAAMTGGTNGQLLASNQRHRRRHETHRQHHHAADAVDAVEVDHCAMRVPARLNARTAGGGCQRRIQRPSCPSSWNPPNRGRLHSCRTAERWSSTQGPEGLTAERSRKRWERNDG